MKLINCLLIALVFISSCKEDTEPAPSFAKDYGEGLYISTDNGVSFYKDGVTKNKIFKEVNGIVLNNVNRIKFQGTKAFIATEKSLFSANVETFEIKGEAGGFMNLVDFDFVAMGRIFAVDKDDAKVKVVDMDRMEITSDVETGDSTKPVFIVTEWYRSFIMNGGAVADSLKDSTIVAIDYRDELVPFANMMGSLHIGDNPNSAVIANGLKVLCKGIYDTNGVVVKTEATLVSIDPWDMSVTSSQTLIGIYNANNLISDDNNTCYFTAEGGVYSMSNYGTGVAPVLGVVSDVLCFQDERYSVYNPADSTNYYYNRNILYVNDAEGSKNTVYKYNLDTSSYMDTIVVDGAVNDINFY
ncbi:MAG: hypothetical protein ACI84S_000003 [Thalassomonas sp.]|jgi:hypothetical protein